MSWSRITYVYCDGGEECQFPGEPYTADAGPDETAAIQRATYNKNGWLFKGGKDYCEGCADRLFPSRRSKPQSGSEE